MSCKALLRELLDLPDTISRQMWLRSQATTLDDAFFDACKAEADRLLRLDLDQCSQWCSLMLEAGERCQRHHPKAQALLAMANLHLIGYGDSLPALDLYDQAASLYAEAGDTVWHARSQIGKISALARLGRYSEALEAGAWAESMLAGPDLWLHRANLLLNCGYVHGRLGDELSSLDCFQRARRLHEQYGEPESPSLAWIDQSTSIALRNLGRLEEASKVCVRAEAMLERLGQRSEAARTRQARGVIAFLSGRYNRALQLLGEAHHVFANDGRHRDAVLADLLICDCLLQLRRYAQVLEHSESMPEVFEQLRLPSEQAHALLNKAVAHAGLRDFNQAQRTLDQARDLFAQEGSEVWLAQVKLERGLLYRVQHRPNETLASARSALAIFRKHALAIQATQAQLLVAWASHERGADQIASKEAQSALAYALSSDLPALSHQGYHLLAQVTRSAGNHKDARRYLDLALDELERMRGRIMVEYRAAYVEDKQAVYEDAIDLALEACDPALALTYVERNKSRALVELLAHHLNLDIKPRSERDTAVAAELGALRARRDLLCRQWEARPDLLDGGWTIDEAERRQAVDEVTDLERRITRLWHEMLVRNADYAHDAELEQVMTDLTLPELPPDVLLAEYTTVRGRVVVLLVQDSHVETVRLDITPRQLTRLERLLWVNLSAVTEADAAYRAMLVDQAQGILRQLYQGLVAPWQDRLRSSRGLILVPQGMMHHLPLCALYDGDRHLVERLPVSVLPSARVLAYCQGMSRETQGALVVGHSHGGIMPSTLAEAHAVNDLLDAHLLVEGQATHDRIVSLATNSSLVHIAAHGAFHEGNPLFAGIELQDGWLTTLDVFGLNLSASLVTLSACESARVEVQGGDELYGLMRAFLHAGAASLLISLWNVDDYSTAGLMSAFYQALMSGETKAESLRQAQCAMLRGNMGDAYRHPYYWAAFSLVGARGRV